MDEFEKAMFQVISKLGDHRSGRTSRVGQAGMPGRMGQTGQGRQGRAALESQAGEEGQVLRAMHLGAGRPCWAGQA